jgi:hypothetical protein
LFDAREWLDDIRLVFFSLDLRDHRLQIFKLQQTVLRLGVE